MSGATLLEPAVARRTLPVRTEAHLLAMARAARHDDGSMGDEPATRTPSEPVARDPRDVALREHAPLDHAAADVEPTVRARRDGTTADAEPAARATHDHTIFPQPKVRSRVTLDEVLSGAWEALLAHESAPCPVCGGAMRPRYGSGPAVVAGRCSRCETVLR